MALVRCILDKFLGVVCHCFPPPLDVPTFAARCLHVRNDTRDHSSERWNYGRERFSGNFAYMASLYTSLGIFYMPTWDRPLYFPSEGRRAEDFFALKNPTAWAGFEPANLGDKGQHATPNSPKPREGYVIFIKVIMYFGLRHVSQSTENSIFGRVVCFRLQSNRVTGKKWVLISP